MNSQNDKSFSGENLMDDIKKYISLIIEDYRLSFVERTALLIGKVVMLGAIGIFILAMLLLLLILLHYLLIEWLQTTWMVALIELGTVGCVGIILWFKREQWIVHPVANMIVKVLCSHLNDDSENDNRNE